jgi:hypothetical protein
MFGCCGFLSFSLVFCLLGGRFETTLYIHFIRRWVKSRRHSSAPRRNENKKKGKKNAILRSAAWRISPVPCLGRGAGGRGGSAQK